MNIIEQRKLYGITTYHSIPAMTSPTIHEYLKELGRNWSGKGVCIELGSWLGASSAALLDGLKESGYNKTYWAFDRWIANHEQTEKARSEGVNLRIGENTSIEYLKNIARRYDKIKAIRGNLPHSLNRYSGEKIEICLFDAPKSEPTFSGCMNVVTKYFIPGITVLGLLDYKFYERHDGNKREKFKAPVMYMKKHKSRFEKIKEWNSECPVFFRFIG